MSQIDLKKLKNALPFGAQAEVADYFNVSPSNVSQVLSGKIKNDKILMALIQKVKDYQERQSAIKKEVEGI